MSMAASDDDAEEFGTRPSLVHTELAEVRRKRDDDRRAEVFSLVLAGISYEAIGERMGISHGEVSNIVARALRDRPRTGVDEMRAIENARLDKAQAAIWSDVLKGDQKAISTYLRINERRSRLNGLDAPMRLDVAVSIRTEMEEALANLEALVFGEVVEGEVVSDDAESG